MKRNVDQMNTYLPTYLGESLPELVTEAFFPCSAALGMKQRTLGKVPWRQDAHVFQLPLPPLLQRTPRYLHPSHILRTDSTRLPISFDHPRQTYICPHRHFLQATSPYRN